jgi:hypothetical protein
MSRRLGSSIQITWRNTPPSPAQLAAWDRLWARLLGATMTEASGLDPHASPAFACPECCLPTNSCTCDREE